MNLSKVLTNNSLKSADTVFGSIKDNSDPRHKTDPCNYFIKIFNRTSLRIIWNNATVCKYDKIIISL
jgi:hypothetical protein